ncbi:MAG: toprim domain-containing protein [Desulfobacterales bacterium]|nr:toprim domain-containing protein [Desulfobacterales bacterium]
MIITSLEKAIIDAGYTPPEAILWDGHLHRFPTDHQKRNSKDGWYVAHDDDKGKAAMFGSWRDGKTHKWSNGTGRRLTDDEIKEIENKKKEALEYEKKNREQSAIRANRIYEQSDQKITYSAYLERKGIECPEGVKAVCGISSKMFGFEKDWQIHGLIVPMKNANGKIVSLQIIPESGNKLFMPHGQSAQAFHILGEINNAETILIAEGIATAQSLRQATGYTVVVAFSAGNIIAVARIIRQQNATAKIIICADDDETGRKNAEEAAQICSGSILLPGHKVNDFNDLHTAKGLDVVKQVVMANNNESWRADLIVKNKSDGTQSIPCRKHNLLLFLEHHEQFKGRIKFNTFSERDALDGVDIDDHIYVNICAELEKYSGITDKITTQDVVETISCISKKYKFNPVQEYLQSLTWDGVSRINTFFHKYCGTQNDQYHTATSRALFISAVLRIQKPGCKVDTMTILEGYQGIGKTQIWNILFSPWHAEITDSLNTKDFFIGLQGIWCADFGELDQFSRAETTRIKQIITMANDNYRGMWGKSHIKHPRKCIFVGGTNNSSWQTDPSGARRFLPIKVTKKIDTVEIAKIKDQLWAEAVQIVKNTDRWWEIPDAEEHQEASYIGDLWEEMIAEWLLLEHHPFEVTIYNILTQALNFTVEKHNKSIQTRIGFIMKRLGWKPVVKRNNGAKIHCYQRF